MNKHQVLNWLNFLAIFVVILVVVTCTWIGAEWIVEHTVHTSRVDGFFATMLSYFLAREYITLERRYGRRKSK